jgi:hypothetical protein
MINVDEQKPVGTIISIPNKLGSLNYFKVPGERIRKLISGGVDPVDPPVNPAPVDPPANVDPEKPPTGEKMVPQTQVNELINVNFGKGYGKAQRESIEEINSLKSEVKNLKAASSGSSDDKDLTALTEEVTSLKATNKTLLNKTKRAEILESLIGHEVYNPEQVIALVSNNVSFDDNDEIVISNEHGKVFDGKGKPANLKDYMTLFLKANENLVKSSGTAGSGGTKPGETHDITMKRATFDSKSPNEKSDFLNSGGKVIN